MISGLPPAFSERKKDLPNMAESASFCVVRRAGGCKVKHKGREPPPKEHLKL